MISAITRKVRAPWGPPISAPMTTSRPPSEASRIVVRRVALKGDCLVVFIAEVLLVEECGRRSIATAGRNEHGGCPLRRPGGVLRGGERVPLRSRPAGRSAQAPPLPA